MKFLKFLGMCALATLVIFVVWAGSYSLEQEFVHRHDYHQITGYDVVNYADDGGYYYIQGVLSAVFVADSTNRFVCDRPYLPNDDSVELAVFKQIKASEELQNQAGSFAVINAYNQLYCKQ